jgi:deoxyribodipyrimidine photolyase
MRELWSTGWMHNRMRVVAASFMTKNMLLPWQVRRGAGEGWLGK